MTKQEFLAMSLPYGLKYKEVGLNEILYFSSRIYNLMSILNWNNSYQPILRPLSDLTKEIEHNGERFVPMTKLLKMEGYEHFFENGHKGKNACVIDCWWINTEFDDKPKPYEKFCTWHLDRVSFEDALKLIEWHFDIADLISKGEAIDVNILEINPYK